MIILREAASRHREPVIRGDALWSMLAFIVQVGLGGIVAIAIGRHFGPEVKGYATLVNIGPPVVAWMLAMGIGHASMYLVAGGRMPADLVLTMSTVIAPVVGLTAAVVGWVILGRSAGPPEVAVALVLGLLLAPLHLLREYHGAVLLGLNRVKRFAQVTIMARLPAAALVLVAVYAFPVPVFYLMIPLSFAISNLLIIGMVFWMLRWRWRWSPHTLREQVRYGVRSHVGNMSEVGVLRFDQFAVYWLLGPTALGFYSVGALCADLLAQAALAASNVFFARIAGAGERARYLARLTIGASALALVAIAIPLVLLADVLVVAFFGQGFRPAADVLRILAFAGAAQGTGRVAVSALRALGSPLRSSAAHLFGILVGVPLVLVLTPGFGINGAAVGTLLMHLVVGAGAYVAIGSVFDRSVRAAAGGGRGEQPARRT